MRLSLLLFLAIIVPSFCSAGVNQTFEQYVDNAAWLADSMGGFIHAGQMDFQVVDNVLNDSVNGSDKVLHVTSAPGSGTGSLRLNFGPIPSGSFSFNVYSPCANGSLNYSAWVFGGDTPTLFHGIHYEYLNQEYLQWGNTEPYGGFQQMEAGNLAAGWHTVSGNWTADGRLNLYYDGVAKVVNGPIRGPLGSGLTYLLIYTPDATGTSINGSDVYIDNLVIGQAGVETYRNGSVELVIDEQGKNISSLKIDGVGAHYIGDANGSMWRIYFADAACLALNDKPAIPSDPPPYYSTTWELGNAFITSRDATLTGKVWDDVAKKLILTYTHAKADVVLTLTLGTETMDVDATVTNKSSDPIQLVQSPASWQLVYGQTEDNTFIMPLNNHGIEYRTLMNFGYWMSTSAWDGFLVTSPSKLLGLFHAQVDGQQPLLSTESTFSGNGGYPGQVGVTAGTICWRTNGESVDKVRVRIGRYDSIRQYADAYNTANFPNQRKLTAKIPADKLDKVSGAMLMSTEGRYNSVANLVDDVPGTIIVHSPIYMHPTIYSSIVWDAFPNYFYPNMAFASVANPNVAQSELENMIAKTNQHGHLFMPRTSFFYWAEGSDADMQLGGDNVAMVRVDGDVQKAYWALPGWIVSPSSEDALNLMYGYFNRWRSIGSSLYFTNVIGALSPIGHRYDFHPDAPRPDLVWDQIYKLMEWHGNQMPLWSEVGCSRQMPYQANFCVEPSWDPEHPGPDHWRYPFRGEYQRYREEMQSYIGHDYVTLSPPNNGGPYPDSPYRLGFSFLHGYTLKWAMDADRMTDFNWRWVRTLAVFSRNVSKCLYGKKLLDFDRDVIPGVHRADYEGNIVTANFTTSSYQSGDRTIAPNGFLVESADGSLLAGYLSRLNGRTMERAELVVIDTSVPGKIRLYAPNATATITVYIPTDPARVSSVIAHHSATNTGSVYYASEAGGLSITIPVFTAGQGSFIPYVEVTTTPVSVSEAKSAQDNSPVTCSGVISAAFDGYFYIESPDRSSGIRISKAGYAATVGHTATVSGTMSTLDSGERCILADSVSSVAGTPVAPLALSNKSLGGGDGVGQAGVADAVGLNNIGLLTRTTGRVTEKGSGWFRIDDGSGFGVKVYGPVPSGTPYVIVTGISSCEKEAGGAILRVLLSTTVQEVAP